MEDALQEFVPLEHTIDKAKYDEMMEFVLSNFPVGEMLQAYIIMRTMCLELERLMDINPLDIKVEL